MSNFANVTFLPFIPFRSILYTKRPTQEPIWWHLSNLIAAALSTCVFQADFHDDKDKVHWHTNDRSLIKLWSCAIIITNKDTSTNFPIIIIIIILIMIFIIMVPLFWQLIRALSMANSLTAVCVSGKGSKRNDLTKRAKGFELQLLLSSLLLFLSLLRPVTAWASVSSVRLCLARCCWWWSKYYWWWLC